MPSFKGTYVHRLDAKGRLAIPSKLRAQLPEGGTLTVSAERCLTLYPAELWRETEHALSGLDALNPDARDTKRRIFGSAEDVNFDSQGRVAIAAHLRDHAGLGREAVVLGVGNVIEVWDADEWRVRSEHIDDNASEIMRRARGGVPQPT
jgi:MraZ protein